MSLPPEMMSVARHCVLVGAMKLNELGADWGKLNATTLDMGSVSHCLLAQLYGSYGKGKKALKLHSNERASHFGFWWYQAVGYEHAKEYYDLLTKLWRERVSEQQARLMPA